MTDEGSVRHDTYWMGQWIPLAERWPGDDSIVIVADIDDFVCAAEVHRFTGVDHLSHIAFSFGDLPITQVTHWMPLPDPPKGTEP